MSPLLRSRRGPSRPGPSRRGGRLRVSALGLLLALAVLLAAPVAGVASAAPGPAATDVAATADRLTRALGAQGAGAYLDASGRLTVNVLGTRAAAQVRAAGATPRLVARSTARLERVKASLDAARNTPAGASWGVDLASNTVLVRVPAGRGAAFVAKARTFGAAVRVERTPAVRTQAFYGGQAILRGGSRCSAGFNTRSASGRHYVLTAGHCANLGGTWTTSGGQTIGPVAASSFPGNDFGAIRISDPATLDPRGGVLVNGAFQDITGAGRVVVGTRACKTGSTTGTTCGPVQAYNVTVRYAEGTVYGLTRTGICTQPGDSGGAMFVGGQAQGITSGGTIGGCSQPNFQSFFQPADEALSTYGLTLL
jgi:streptogrisin D